MFKVIRTFILDPLEFIPLFVVFILFRLLPVAWASWLAGRMARFLCPLLPVHQVGVQNLKKAFPTWTAQKREGVLKDAWENLGRVVGEFPHVQRIARTRTQVVDHCGLDTIEQHTASRIFFSAHMANWEIPHLVLTVRGMQISLLSRPPNNWVTRLFFQWIRKDPKVKIILKGAEGSKDFLRTLQGGQNMGILLDQRLSEGINIPFFGRPALTPVGPGKFAARFGALMIPVQVVRMPNARFKIIYHKAIKTPGDPEKIARNINTIYETWITEHPDQWLWFHNRWKL